ncbi:TolC family protein [Beijerinckia mobilis]|uniref:TolC family protein n=1 Tax=Beijerinckia mobilis TaxID=231434 RepID=UPI001FD8781B|nr:TolC family protein [Beijerinckia mobilis]
MRRPDPMFPRPAFQPRQGRSLDGDERRSHELPLGWFRVWPLTILLPAVLLANGCATNAIDLAPPEPDRPFVPQTKENGAIDAGKPALNPGLAPKRQDFTLPANAETAGLPAPPELEAHKIYSLAELIDIAQRNNPTTRIAWNHAREAALAVGLVESTYLPRLTISAIGGTQQSNNNLTTGVLGLESTATNKANGQGIIGAAGLQWLLFDFGRRAALVEAAQQLSAITNVNFTAAHQLLIHKVSLAYYAYSAARARTNNAVGSLENAKKVQAAAEARLKQEVGTIVDAAQAKQATLQANLQLVRARGAEQDNYQTLLGAMGISPLTKIRVTSAEGRTLSASMVPTTQSILEAALAKRPDILAAFAAQKASEANIRAAEADFLPKVFASGTVAEGSGGLGVTSIPAIGADALPTLNLNNNRFSGIILGGVTVPLYDGGTRAALLLQARERREGADAILSRTKQEAAREIVSAQNGLKTSLAAYQASVALVQAAETTFDAALAAYRNGVGSVTAASLAETNLLQARIAKTDAYSAALAAAVTLALASSSLGSVPY